MNDQFIICQKIKSKMYALAGTNDKTCLANAQSAFQKAGFDIRTLFTRYSEQATLQNNFAGKVAEYVTI